MSTCESDGVGRVFVAGGIAGSRTVGYAMLYDVDEDRWVLLPDMAQARGCWFFHVSHHDWSVEEDFLPRGFHWMHPMGSKWISWSCWSKKARMGAWRAIYDRSLKAVPVCCIGKEAVCLAIDIVMRTILYTWSH